MIISSIRMVVIRAALLLACAAAAEAAPAPPDLDQTEKVPLDVFTSTTAYVFESDLDHVDHGNAGSMDALQNSFEYAHRFFLTGQWYLHTGVAYSRFDFGNTDAPVPVHLQSGAVVLGVEYMKGEDTGAFLQFRPGFYTEEHLGISSFDCPILAGRFWVWQPDKLYFLTGVYTSFLRGGWPVLPFAGIVWKPNDHIKLMGVPPNPRLIYICNKQFEVYVGGELAGGSFRTDHHPGYDNIPHVDKLSGTQVDYTDYRGGGGFTYYLANNISVDGAAGYSFERSFDYNRAGEKFRTDPTPYLSISFKAQF